MNLFALSGLLIGISSTAMAVLMLFIGKERFHYVWSLFCVSVAIWGFGAYGIATTKNIETADLLWRITHIGVIFIPILFTHFVYLFLKKYNRLFLWSIYGLGALFLASDLWGNLFITNMRWVFEQYYHTSPPGLLYIPFTFFFFGLVFYAHWLLWLRLRIARGIEKTQIQYFLFAMAVSFSGGGLTFLVVYGIDFYPVFNILAFLYTPILTYAILKKQLFDIRVVLTQFFVGIIAILLFINLVLSQSSFEYFWKGSLFMAFLIAGYLLVRSVMNEIKQREELQGAYAKLKELDEAKSEFVSIASHQLRTPLTAIKGYISMIMEGSYGQLQETQEKPMKSVYESNERLIRLVNDLLNISRIESGRTDMKWVKKNIADVIESVIEEIGIKAQEKKLKLIFEKPVESLPEISLDEEKIRNVLLNVVDNAIRYTKKGKIIIRTYVKQDASQKRKGLVIEVKDTGDGMTQEEINHLFESFSRGGAGTRMSTEGAGLGLYIAEQFMKLHKGKIWAESEGRGEGSTFYIELPVQ